MKKLKRMMNYHCWKQLKIKIYLMLKAEKYDCRKSGTKKMKQHVPLIFEYSNRDLVSQNIHRHLLDNC